MAMTLGNESVVLDCLVVTCTSRVTKLLSGPRAESVKVLSMPAWKEDFIRLEQRRGATGQTKDQDRLGKDLQAKGSTEVWVLSLGRVRGCVAVVGNQWNTTGAVTGDRVSQKSTLLWSNRPEARKQQWGGGGWGRLTSVSEKGFHALISVFPCRGHKTVILEGGGKVKGGRFCGGGW